MPAFMAGMGMRQGMPRRQFNKQPAQANQFTQALNAAGGQPPGGAATPATGAQTGGVDQKPPAAGPGAAPTTYNNPYAAAASGGANPWQYNAQTGGYQPNNTAYMPDWMRKPPPPPPAPPTKKERQVKDYTAYADDMTGTSQQAIDILNKESAKRGKPIDINALTAKYGGQVQNNVVTGKLFNEIMKDVFGEDVDVPDTSKPTQPAPVEPAPAPIPLPDRIQRYDYGPRGDGMNWTADRPTPRPIDGGDLAGQPGSPTGQWMNDYRRDPSSEGGAKDMLYRGNYGGAPTPVGTPDASQNPQFQQYMKQFQDMLAGMKGMGG